MVKGQAWGWTGQIPLGGGSKGETVGLLLKGEGDLVAMDMKDADISNAVLDLVMIISVQLSFSSPRLLRLLGMSGAKSYSVWRRHNLGTELNLNQLDI